MLPAAEKITPRHRERHAYIYIRQSTLRQVHQNRESQANQYALVERAVALGWIPERIHVIDADLGQSGRDGQRPGFTDLVAEVSLGRAGIVLSYEASRLARSNAGWYALLDLASVVGTLIGDTDGVYDPRLYNDRLLLGLRGIFSEAELHLLQLRLAAGRMRQIERGTYRQQLPTGLVRRPDGQVAKDPDLQVQRTILLVLERFRALGSCQ
jgi:DNA invertase Pin-like site-specific DNA recombinase